MLPFGSFVFVNSLGGSYRKIISSAVSHIFPLQHHHIKLKSPLTGQQADDSCAYKHLSSQEEKSGFAADGQHPFAPPKQPWCLIRFPCKKKTKKKEEKKKRRTHTHTHNRRAFIPLAVFFPRHVRIWPPPPHPSRRHFSPEPPATGAGSARPVVSMMTSSSGLGEGSGGSPGTPLGGWEPRNGFFLFCPLGCSTSAFLQWVV